MKFLLWLAVALVVAAWLMRDKKPLKSPESSRQAASAGMAEGQAESMVPCAHCGVHIPVSESLAGPTGALFCSDEHRRLHA